MYFYVMYFKQCVMYAGCVIVHRLFLLLPPPLHADVPPVGDCRSAEAVSQGYQLFYGKYYLVHDDLQATAADARAACQVAGADLAIFKTPDDYNAVVEVMGKWILCNIRTVKPNYKWKWFTGKKNILLIRNFHLSKRYHETVSPSSHQYSQVSI